MDRDDSPKKITANDLIGLTFFAVCGGDYGIEDAVGAAGPAWTLSALLACCVSNPVPASENLLLLIPLRHAVTCESKQKRGKPFHARTFLSLSIVMCFYEI